MAQKISVIIPNYNGKDLIKKNLPNVIKNCPDCEIIIVDDGSEDDSTNFIKERFKNVKLIIHKKNQGFVSAVNSGVNAARGKYVLLLNSDVSPRSNFLKPLLENFSANSDLFAVAIKDVSHEQRETLIKGRGGARFEKGFVSHFPMSTDVKAQTLWVSGGSGLFDRSMFLKLGGFDRAFAPFYWEDIDLSYRARKLGLICLFEPKSIVDHYHEKGAIKTHHRDFFIKTISYKNQFIFVWKNISDYSLLTRHLAWLPFHFVRALFQKDWAFFLGFFRAALQIPQLVLNYDQLKAKTNVSDKEILTKFEKQ